MIGVFIADDHAVLRMGLRALIDGQHDMQVVGEAGDGQSAERGILESGPDVAVIDVSMPGQDGIETIRRLFRMRPSTRVLMFTIHDEPGFVQAAVAAGAAGYVEKRAVDSELVAAIRAVAQGRAFMNVSSHPMGDANAAQGPTPARPTDLGLLSRRERDVLERVAEGYTNREVADELGFSIKSAEAYRARAMGKLGLRSRVELVRYSLECGLLRRGKPAR